MKRSTIIVILLVIGIVSYPVIYFLIQYSQNQKIAEEKIENVKPIVKEYLESKYNEKMVIYEGGGKDEEMYYLWAYSEINPKIPFRVRYISWKDRIEDRFEDDYLIEYAQYKADEYVLAVIKDVIKEDFTFYVRIDNGESEIEKLEKYYKENGKFMDWCDVEKEIRCIYLDIYTKRLINSTKVDTTPIIEAIETLDFVARTIDIDIRMFEILNDYFDGELVSYRYVDGKYVLDER